ncbi:GntR family transcriptional regulator [Virgibacillus ndiopensis]|uniref:GntR family transcriptional regulator n=1 Tax=Virgibacillus ndiopensis TaxID=2004408 RepID=UPI000C0791A7|nr:GntR family transcriptional regulator [Virgibacillus ndiopensis]
MELNKSVSTPLYHQIKDYLEDKITKGEWEPGYRLPTEKELANQFNVSNITVKRAILELVNEGILYRKSGKGTFVIKKEEQDISKLVSLRNEADDDQQHPHKTLSFSKVMAGTNIGNQLEINSEEMVYKINRLKIKEGDPEVIEYSFIPSGVFPDLSQTDIEDELLYNIFLKKYGIELGKAKIFFSTIIADDYEADLLNVPKGEQLFVLERYTVTVKNQIIEYSKFILKQDQPRYFLEVQL